MKTKYKIVDYTHIEPRPTVFGANFLVEDAEKPDGLFHRVSVRIALVIEEMTDVSAGLELTFQYLSAAESDFKTCLLHDLTPFFRQTAPKFVEAFLEDLKKFLQECAPETYFVQMFLKYEDEFAPQIKFVPTNINDVN